MRFSSRDGIALIVAAGLAVGFVYLTKLAGFAWIVVALPYAILVIPCVAIYVADEQKLLVWQVSVLTFVLCVLGNSIIGRGQMPWNVGVRVVFVFWALGTILSSPAPVYWFLRRRRGRTRYYAATIIAVVTIVLLLLVHRITR
jgi:hypothetical protein